MHELSGKRQRRATEFVFTRQQPTGDDSAPTYDASTTTQKALQGRQIKPLPGASSSASLSAQQKSQASQLGSGLKHGAGEVGPDAPPSTNSQSAQQPPNDDGTPTALEIARHRRFHISRSSISSRTQSPVLGGKIQKRTPTVFVERRTRRRPSPDGTTTPPTQQPTTPTTPLPEPARPQKKPGLAARVPAKKNSQSSLAPAAAPSTPARNVSLPSGLVMPWDVTSEQLAKEMQAYTLQEIGRSIAASEAPTHPPPPPSRATPRKSTPSRFKPRKPALRYQERHPDEVVPTTHSGMDMDTDVSEAEEEEDEEEEEEGEYVIDTYIRIPTTSLPPSITANDPESSFGLLVLDSQPDIDAFYHSSSDTNSDLDDEEEEDENAENHYSADYPDDEVDSDDEFDRNVYRYHHMQEPEDEEGFDDATFSDDEDLHKGDDATRFPWGRGRGWMVGRVDRDVDEF